MDTKSRHIKKKLAVSSKTEKLSEIRNFVSDIAEKAGLKRQEIDDIILAVDEACTNIIKHAYKSFPEGEILIEIEYNSKTFTVKLIDYGTSFEPDLIPDPDLQKYYRQRRVGGLGLYLMRTLMDDVQYISVPGKYNQILLSKNLTD